MIERQTTETRTATAWPYIVMAVVIAAIVGLLVWAPWTDSTSRSTNTNSSTTTTQSTAP